MLFSTMAVLSRNGKMQSIIIMHDLTGEDCGEGRQ
jgi:hypothetical protein